MIALIVLLLVLLVMAEPASFRPPRWRTSSKRPASSRKNKESGSPAQTQRQGQAPADTSRAEFTIESMIEMLKLTESNPFDGNADEKAINEGKEKQDDETRTLRDQLILQQFKMAGQT